MSDDKKRVHLARMLAEKGGRVWVLFDEEHTLRGRTGESQKTLLARWRQAHGEVGVLVRIRGVCRPSELAKQLADLQQPCEGRESNPTQDAPQEGAGMKPFRTRDGRLIVNQLCRCGHAQSRHGHPAQEKPPRRSCLEDGCPCRTFSFREFIYEEKT